MEKLHVQSNHATPFQAVHARDGDPSVAELNRQIAELQATAQAKLAAYEREQSHQKQRDRELDLQTLANLRQEVAELDEVAKLAGKLTLDEARKIGRQRTKYLADIAELEEKYGLGKSAQLAVPPPAEQKSVWPTAGKIGALLILCWMIVLYSGEWILSKYPNAAIYNEVSFQKVLFGLSVYIAGFVSVVLAMNVFFPGFGKYFNPFNQSRIDFYTDFKALTEWQRNVIALLLFCALLLAYVLTVSGKLD
jgi:hypothetical protein